MAESVDLTDFSGGILEAVSPGDFTERQWASLKGFVLESEVSTRSQWACQPVGGAAGVGHTWLAVRGFVASKGRYLLALRSDGHVFWSLAPARTASRVDTAAVTWTQITTATPAEGGVDVQLAGNPYYRFLCETLVIVDQAYKSGVLLHSALGNDFALVVYEKADGGLAAKRYNKFFPKDDVVTNADGTETRTPGKYTMPRANVGVMWKDYLILGDVWRKKDAKLAMDATNQARASGALWISANPFANGGQFIDQFDEGQGLLTNLVSVEATIVGLQVIDQGLLIFTTSTNAGDGVVLLRGRPGFKDDGNTSFEPEVLRSGMGLPKNTSLTAQGGHTVWSEAGIVAFVEDKGTIWHTNGSDTGRLDRYGPTPPSFATETDHVCALGPYLFASRAGRLLVMRMFEEDGAWTELVTPHAGVQPRAMTVVEDCLYFTSNGEMWRYAMGVDAERGLVNGTAVPLTVSTPTLGDPLRHDKKKWFRLGVRATNVRDGRITNLAVKGGPALATGTYPTYTVALNHNLAEREEVVVPCHGPSVEASATVTFTGDVLLESVSFWVHGGKPSR